MLSIVFCKYNWKSKFLTKSSTPLYNFNILKHDFDVWLNSLQDDAKYKLRSLISKLNNDAKKILKHKAELICKSSGINISKMIVEMK